MLICQVGSTISECHFRFASNTSEMRMIFLRPSEANSMPSKSALTDILTCQPVSTISETHLLVASNAAVAPMNSSCQRYRITASVLHLLLVLLHFVSMLLKDGLLYRTNHPSHH